MCIRDRARKGRDADLEQLDLAQEAGQPAEDDMAQACQRPVQQCGNDSTGQDIAKVTERHADGGRDLRQHIDGCHDEDRVQQALQVGKDAVGPVSYTHLDVYKRQVWNGVSICLMQPPTPGQWCTAWQSCGSS